MWNWPQGEDRRGGLSGPGDHRADLLPLASEVRWHAAGNGQAVEGVAEGELSPEEGGCRTGAGHGDPSRGRPGKLVGPRRVAAVTEVRRRLGPDRVSERRACRVLAQPRSSYRHQRRSRKGEARNRRLLLEMRRISRANPRYGVPRIHRELRSDGWRVNSKRVHRLWKQESMQVPRKQHRKRRLSLGGSQNSCVRHRAMRRNHVWSYDFVAERTEDGVARCGCWW